MRDGSISQSLPEQKADHTDDHRKYSRFSAVQLTYNLRNMWFFFLGNWTGHVKAFVLIDQLRIHDIIASSFFYCFSCPNAIDAEEVHAAVVA